MKTATCSHFLYYNPLGLPRISYDDIVQNRADGVHVEQRELARRFVRMPPAFHDDPDRAERAMRMARSLRFTSGRTERKECADGARDGQRQSGRLAQDDGRRGVCRRTCSSRLGGEQALTAASGPEKCDAARLARGGAGGPGRRGARGSAKGLVLSSGRKVHRRLRALSGAACALRSRSVYAFLRAA
jgi:hypothetical protein